MPFVIFAEHLEITLIYKEMDCVVRIQQKRSHLPWRVISQEEKRPFSDYCLRQFVVHVSMCACVRGVPEVSSGVVSWNFSSDWIVQTGDNFCTNCKLFKAYYREEKSVYCSYFIAFNLIPQR